MAIKWAIKRKNDATRIIETRRAILRDQAKRKKENLLAKTYRIQGAELKAKRLQQLQN